MSAFEPRDRAPLRVCFPFVGDDIGGSHISALKLIQGLDRRRVTPVVVVERPTGPLGDRLTREGVRWVNLALGETLAPGGRDPLAAAAYFARTLPLVRRFLREGQFDIVHTNDGRTHVNWGLGARLAGAGQVWHHRGDPTARGVNRLAPLIARQVVAVSRFARPRRPILPLGDRLKVIHSPFEHPAFYPDRAAARRTLLSELGLPESTHVLGYFGGLIDRKRPLLFVDIVHRFRRRHPEIPVVGCLFGVSPPQGPDFETAVRERAAALGLSDDAIRLMGFRTPVEPCMSATDILLVPAVNEPFGRTLIEAMFLGTAVIATAHGGNPEAIRDGETGFLVEPENADAFVEPIRHLLSDASAFLRVTDAAHVEALKTYSVAHHVAEVMEVYGRAAAHRRPVPSMGHWRESVS
ncbi:glycosyltransferase family 4 protein [Aureimonas sp. AU12]|uniref:glycosyltransferase family 4 protein n=1 Tax=Aureimonas sp. AU12 TaxID=1638161 RepID=UPI000781083F|nr:glycosyltransferase family 4 protein [Aureimonas sp. AU12]